MGMFDAGWLNLWSFLLGLVAWILPIINIFKLRNPEHRKWEWECAMLSLVSMTACAVSLLMQIMYHDHLVNIEDWSALMDTSYAVVFAACVLLGVTVVLNAVVAIIYRKAAR